MKKKEKEILGLKKTVKKELIGNAIVMVIIVLCSWGLTFVLLGPATTNATYFGYMACMIPFFTIVQTYSPLVHKRAEFTHGKWELIDEEKNLPKQPVVNLWNRLLPSALAYGIGAMLLVIALIKLTGWQLQTVSANLIVLAVLITTTSLLINKHLGEDMLAFAQSNRAGLSSPNQTAAGYIVVEHALPFILLQGFINACVANRGFRFEAAKAGVDYVPAKALVPDAFIVFVILALIQWMFSSWLSQGDMQLGRVPSKWSQGLSWWKALLGILLAAIGVSLIYKLILVLGGLPGLSIEMAILFKIAVVATGVIFGAWIGIHRGSCQALVEKEQ